MRTQIIADRAKQRQPVAHKEIIWSLSNSTRRIVAVARLLKIAVKFAAELLRELISR